MARKTNALEMLRDDHQRVQTLFQRFEKAKGAEQDKLCREVVDALKLHTRIEEEVFYPYIRQTTDQVDLVEEANVEHFAAKQLMRELESGRDGIHRHAVVKVLSEYVGHHIREEEQKIFPLIEKTGVDLEALGEELLEHRKGRHKGSVEDETSGGNPGGAQASAEVQVPAHSRKEDEAYRKQYLKDLGKSAQRAKWIYSPDEHEDYPGQTLATRNPAVILRWAQERGGRPATTPGGDPNNPRVLRINFPDYDESLTPVSWDAWFRVFDERKIVFLFQEHTKDGRQSNFFQFDSPFREDG